MLEQGFIKNPLVLAKGNCSKLIARPSIRHSQMWTYTSKTNDKFINFSLLQTVQNNFFHVLRIWEFYQNKLALFWSQIDRLRQNRTPNKTLQAKAEILPRRSAKETYLK